MTVARVRRARFLRGALVGLSLFFSVSSASAEEAHVIEADVMPGVSRLLSPRPTKGRETQGSLVRPSFTFAVFYRSPYFLEPFLEAGVFSLYASSQRKQATGFGEISGQSTMSTLAFTVGAAVSFWRLRARFGIGSHQLKLTSTVLGNTITTTEGDMSYMAALSGAIYRVPRLSIGAELRVDTLVAASVTFATLGVVVAGDAITF